MLHHNLICIFVHVSVLPLELPPSPVSTPVQSEEAPDSNTSTIGTFLSSFLPGSTGLRRSQSVAIRSTRGKEHSSISAEIRRQRLMAGGRKADESLPASMHTTSTSLNDPSTAPPFKRTFSERRSKQVWNVHFGFLTNVSRCCSSFVLNFRIKILFIGPFYHRCLFLH